ncbi:MAG: helix-turn-helix transcriptional regulator [Oscillospiraceae bacterium]|nr:helix-turn-helix transcriptional regulator [Oscillospiraceae bacterium]
MLIPEYADTHHLGKQSVRLSTECTRRRNVAHMHGNMQLCYVNSGSLIHSINGREYIQTAGSCAIIPPFTGHTPNLHKSDDTPVISFISFYDTFLSDRGYNFFPFLLNGTFFNGFLIPHFYQFDSERIPLANSIIYSLRAEVNSKSGTNFDKIAALIADLLGMMCETTSDFKISKPIQKNKEMVFKTIEYFNNNYQKKIVIDDICELLSVSRGTLTKNFKLFTGYTCNQVLTSIRLYQAIMFYGFGFSKDETARFSGLGDITNLSRTFKKCFGLSMDRYYKERQFITLFGKLDKI